MPAELATCAERVDERADERAHERSASAGSSGRAAVARPPAAGTGEVGDKGSGLRLRETMRLRPKRWSRLSAEGGANAADGITAHQPRQRLLVDTS